MGDMVFLFAPPEYWKLTGEERKNYRCGPGRGILERIIPDKILGCDIQPACGIHDFQYGQGRTDQDKADADEVFLNNMIRLIEAYGGRECMVRWRLNIAREYYEAVQHYGGPAYWNEKNKPDEIGLVAAPA